MGYLLDSCICIYYINGKKPRVRHNIHKHAEQDMFVSAITKGEMFAGSLGSKTPQRSREKQELFFSRFRSLPFDDDAAEQYANIYAHLKKSGLLIKVSDMQIAAIAMARSLIVITNDTDDFGRIPGLNVEDWTAT